MDDEETRIQLRTWIDALAKSDRPAEREVSALANKYLERYDASTSSVSMVLCALTPLIVNENPETAVKSARSTLRSLP